MLLRVGGCWCASPIRAVAALLGPLAGRRRHARCAPPARALVAGPAGRAVPGGVLAAWWLPALVSPILVAALRKPLNARCRPPSRHSTRLAAQRALGAAQRA
ncbi:MAG TPA: hypothetical protein VFS21_29660 [Roseiflexaceae bacterium]|nr:hypothetical protein [Roseiflexaceae bacterium]